MNEKKVLFVLRKASIGGSCTSLINLLSLFKEQGVVFDVFLMDHSGVLTDRIAQNANLLPENVMLSSAIKEKKMLTGFLQYAYRCGFVLNHKLFGTGVAVRRLYEAAAKSLNGKYDHVIAYQEGETTEFVQYIKTPHKIAFLHNDVERFWLSGNKVTLQKLYDTFQDIACVSKAAMESIRRNLQWDEGRLHLIRNTLPEHWLRERAKIPVDSGDEKKKRFLFVSVGRMAPQKAFERIPKAAKLLKQWDVDFDWYIIGDGAEKEKVVAQILRCEVADCVHLLGAKMNPHAYMRICDCVVLTSRYEAQPMVANEALILDKPVISTEFSSVYEVIQNGENGMIVPQIPEAIANALMKFTSDEEYRKKLQAGAEQFCYPNEKVMDALQNLLN